MLWLYVPDYNHNGSMESIPKIHDRNGTVIWEEDPYCGGFVISNKDCYLRTSEMELVSYTPVQCRDGSFDTNCEELVAYARFDKQSQKV